MTTYERRRTIVEIVNRQKSTSVAELAQRLAVSEGTIRNDLEMLDDLRQLLRVRGGAVALESTPRRESVLLSRARVNDNKKRWMAQWAAGMIESGDVVLFDASSTAWHIASFLEDRHNLTVITNGLEIGRALASQPTNTVILLGGVLRADGNVIVGDMSESILRHIQAQYAFVSCTGFSVDRGLLETDLQEAELKSLMLRAAQRTIALVDSSKVRTRGLAPFATLEQIDSFVTDIEMSTNVIEQIRHSGANVVVCGPHSVSSYAPYNGHDQCCRIAFANLSEAIPFGREVRRGLEAAAADAHNVELIVADNQLSGQLALGVLEDLIAQAPNLIIEYQVDEKAGNLIAHRLKDVGIPAIAVDIPMVGAVFVGVDNYEVGLVAGRALGRAVQVEWGGAFDRLVVLEHPRAGQLPALRIQGQIDGLCEHIDPVDETRIVRLDSGNTLAVSREQTSRLLETLPPDTRLPVICFNDDAALGALEAARALGRERNVLIVGQGADRYLRDELRRPGTRIVGSTAFHPELYGQTLIAISLKILAGGITPPAVYVPHTFIDRHNVDQYYPAVSS